MATTKRRNPGNRRSGAVKGTPSGLRRGQLPWREDGLIVQRVNLVRTLRAQGYTAFGMLERVNELMAQNSVPSITTQTIYDDFSRIKDLEAEETAATQQDIEGRVRSRIEALEEVKRSAWEAFYAAGAASLNRGSYLNTIRAAEMNIARLQGLLRERIEVLTMDLSPEGFGPSPRALLEAGEITAEQYEHYLEVSYRVAGGAPLPGVVASASGARTAVVIEGSATPVSAETEDNLDGLDDLDDLAASSSRGRPFGVVVEDYVPGLEFEAGR